MALTVLNFKHTSRLRKRIPPDVLKLYEKENVLRMVSYHLAKGKLELFQQAFHIPVFYGLFLSGALVYATSALNRMVDNEILRAVLFLTAESISLAS